MESRTNEPRPTETKGARAEVPADASPAVRCILALPESSPVPPADLVEAFAARNLEVRECLGPFEAMALMVSLARDTKRPLALVVVEPSQFSGDRAAQLMQSAAKYTGRAARWMYERKRAPRLQKWIEPETSPTKVNGIRDAIRRAQGAPSLRLTGFAETNASEARPAENGGEPSASASGALLTDEELAMLLGRDEPDAPHPGDPTESMDFDEPDDHPPSYDRTSS